MAEVDPDLLEWNYGQYEGRTSAQILAERPDWSLFRDGCPSGEMPEQVGARADRVIRRVRDLHQDVLLFSMAGHSPRLGSAWLGLWKLAGGKYFLLNTASLSALGYEHDPSQPVIQFWDDTRHVGA